MFLPREPRGEVANRRVLSGGEAIVTFSDLISFVIMICAIVTLVVILPTVRFFLTFGSLVKIFISQGSILSIQRNRRNEVIHISRKPHIWYPGAIYHVMSRGNRQQNIFKCDDDYQLFLLLLEETMSKYPFLLHSYCLMTNHIHLQVETRDNDISKIMSHLLKGYSTCFNQKYNFVGHLFQGRYKGILIENDNYFLQTSRYIHLNPFKARMVQCPSDYIYSSYPFYVRNNNSSILTKDATLKYFSGNFEQYRLFVENHIDYKSQEDNIRKEMGENELWLPW